MNQIMTVEVNSRIAFQVIAFGGNYAAFSVAPNGGRGAPKGRRFGRGNNPADAIFACWEDVYDDTEAYLGETEFIDRLKKTPDAIRVERRGLRRLLDEGIGDQMRRLPPFNPSANYTWSEGEWRRTSKYPKCGTVPEFDDVNGQIVPATSPEAALIALLNPTRPSIGD